MRTVIERISNKLLPHSTANCIQSPVINHDGGTSLLVEGLRLRLSEAGTQVSSLVGELGPACRGCRFPRRSEDPVGHKFKNNF